MPSAEDQSTLLREIAELRAELREVAAASMGDAELRTSDGLSRAWDSSDPRNQVEGMETEVEKRVWKSGTAEQEEQCCQQGEPEAVAGSSAAKRGSTASTA